MPVLTSRPTLLLPLSLVLLLCSCGGEEEPPAAQDRCSFDGLSSYLVGHIEDRDARTELLLQSPNDTPGLVNTNEIRLQVGTATPPEGDRSEPVLIRIFDAHSEDLLLRRLSDLTEDGPLTLEVIDATETAAGSGGLTELDDFDCAIDEGTICVQFGFDTDDNAILQDEDEFVYNASTGSLTIRDVDNIRRLFTVQLNVELGPNLLQFQDESTGALQGCMTPGYDSTGDEFWPLN